MDNKFFILGVFLISIIILSSLSIVSAIPVQVHFESSINAPYWCGANSGATGFYYGVYIDNVCISNNALIELTPGEHFIFINQDVGHNENSYSVAAKLTSSSGIFNNGNTFLVTNDNWKDCGIGSYDWCLSNYNSRSFASVDTAYSSTLSEASYIKSTSDNRRCEVAYKFTINYPACTPTWILEDDWSQCDITDHKYKDYYDKNNCNNNTGKPSRVSTSCDYCSFNPLYTSWSAWYDITGCYSNNTKVQERTRVEYDSNHQLCYQVTHLPSDLWNNGRNITEYDLRVVDCQYNPSCTPSLLNTSFSSWVDLGICNNRDKQNKSRYATQYDINNCGTFANKTTYEYQEVDCNFCSENIIPLFSMWSNCINNIQTRTKSFIDANYASCCAVTNLESDCHINNGSYSSVNETRSCQPGCTEDWTCSSWSDCANNIQTRTCYDKNNCGTTNDKPATSKSCDEKKKDVKCTEQKIYGNISIDETRVEEIHSGIAIGNLSTSNTARKIANLPILLGLLFFSILLLILLIILALSVRN